MTFFGRRQVVVRGPAASPHQVAVVVVVVIEVVVVAVAKVVVVVVVAVAKVVVVVVVAHKFRDCLAFFPLVRRAIHSWPKI